MKNSNSVTSLAEAREMDMVGYLAGLGHEPAKIRGADYWYLSPLRTEKTPSFKVNRRLNRWYDHGLGQGGNLVDFGIRYHQCSAAEFLRKINGGIPSRRPALPVADPPETRAGEGRITILRESPLTSPALLRYLAQRRIPAAIAGMFCRQVGYRIGDRDYYGIGFKNDSGGYEIRTPHIKIGSSPKDITSIRNGADEVRVFEGFCDFLSFLAAGPEPAPQQADFLILNSVSLFVKARPFMELHGTVRLYLDNDEAGQKCTADALSLGVKYVDESHLYAGHKDVNEWLADSRQDLRRYRGIRP